MVFPPKQQTAEARICVDIGQTNRIRVEHPGLIGGLGNWVLFPLAVPVIDRLHRSGSLPGLPDRRSQDGRLRQSDKSKRLSDLLR